MADALALAASAAAFDAFTASAACPWSIDHEASCAEAAEMQATEISKAPNMVRILQSLLELKLSRCLLLSEEC
jgi:hypothetical protein